MNRFGKFLVVSLAFALLSCAGKAAKNTAPLPEEEISAQPKAPPATVEDPRDGLTPPPSAQTGQPGPATIMKHDFEAVAPTEEGPEPEKPLPGPTAKGPSLGPEPGAQEAQPAKEKDRVVVTGPMTVNLRSGPGTDYAVMGQAVEGESFEFVSTSEERYQGEPWYRVKDENGRYAYIWGGLAKKMKIPLTGRGERASRFTKIRTRDTLTPPIPKELRATREISLNFEAVDIREIIQTFSELLKLNYIVEPGVAGTVTLHTYNKIPVRDLFKMFEQILTLNNISVVRKGNFYHFMPILEAKKNPLGIYHGKRKESIPNEDRLIIQIIPLSYISSGSLKDTIAPLLSKNAHFINLEATNTLIVVELASNIRRLLDIISALDVNTIENTDIEIFPLNYSDAIEISGSLQDIFTNLGYQSQGAVSLKFVPIKRLNSILVVSSFPNLMPRVEHWLKKLDQPMVEGQTATYVYYLQNAEAGKIAGVLNGIYNKPKTEEELTQQKRKRGLKERAKNKGTKKAGQAKVEVPQDLRLGEIEGEVVILPDADTNSLLVRTDPKNYPAIEETIKKLDLMPLQVLIEVLIMDVALDESNSFGIEWALKGSMDTPAFDFSLNSSQGLGVGTPGGIGQAASMFAGGAGSLGLFVGNASKVLSMIKASGLKEKANVLSSPVIITSENKAATINIVNQIPITTATLITQSAGTPITQETVEYRDVGISLSVLPKINNKGFVNMQIAQQVSSVVETGGTNPRFFTRSANTNVIVKDKETIIVGGLMSTSNSKSKTGIPYLSKIPVLGKIFSSEKDSVNKSELLIFITPHVITDWKEGRAVTHHFREKLKLLKNSTKQIKIGEPSG